MDVKAEQKTIEERGVQSCHSRIKAFKLEENIHKEKKIKRWFLHFQTFLKAGFDVKNDCIPTMTLRGNR